MAQDRLEECLQAVVTGTHPRTIERRGRIKRMTFKYSVVKIKTKLNEGEEHFNHYGQLRGV